MVSRRTYLGAVAGATSLLTGCLSSGLPSSSSQVLRTVSQVGTETERLSVEVNVIRCEVTTERTATVEIRLRNPTSEPIEIHLDDGPDADPLLSHTYEDGKRVDTAVQLLPVVNADLVERASRECWNPAEPTGGDLVPTTRELAPGESLANEYQLWGRRDASECLPPDTYDFGNWAEGSPGSWEVTLELNRAES